MDLMISDIDNEFKQAFQDFNQGNLEFAEARLLKIIKHQPQNLTALELLGIIYLYSGNYKQSLIQFEKILVLVPDRSVVWANHGNALQELHLYDKAIQSYDKCLKIDSSSYDTWYNRGKALKQLKLYQEALVSFQKSISSNHNNLDALLAIGNIYQELHQFENAFVYYEKVVNINDHFIDGWINRGIVLNELKHYEESIISFNKAISLNPNSAESWLNKGNVLLNLKIFDKSLSSFDNAIKIKSDYAEAWYNRGNVLHILGKFEESLSSFENAIKLKPNYSDAWSNRGYLLQKMRRYQEALNSYNKAININADLVEAWSNRGIVLQYLKKYQLALESHDKAIKLNINDPQSYYNRSLLRLTLKDFEEGFIDYKYRWHSKEQFGGYIKTSISNATRNTMKGKILLWAEQGLGDEVFFAGLYPMLIKNDLDITLSADKRLHTILKRSFPNFQLVDRFQLEKYNINSNYDIHAPIGDLGYLLSIDKLKVINTRSTYLIYDKIKMNCFRNLFTINKDNISNKILCGLSWKSSNKNIGDDKSISLLSLGNLLCNSDIHFINLQYGDVYNDIKSINEKYSISIYESKFIDLYNDIDELLAMIAACDVIVTISNVTAHLAGSIGKPVALILPNPSGKLWYWHEGDDYSLWYPSIKIFYNDDDNSFDKTIINIKNWINNLQSIQQQQ